MRPTICIKCGREIPAGATRCPSCGAPELRPADEVARRLLLWGAIVIGVVLAFWLAWAFGLF